MREIQEQLDLSEIRVDETVIKHREQRLKWRKGMQEYCDKASTSDRAERTGWCVCGNMIFCDYCKAAVRKTYSRACVNAIEDRCAACNISIDYARTDYEKQLEEIEA